MPLSDFKNEMQRATAFRLTRIQSIVVYALDVNIFLMTYTPMGVACRDRVVNKVQPPVRERINR